MLSDEQIISPEKFKELLLEAQTKYNIDLIDITPEDVGRISAYISRYVIQSTARAMIEWLEEPCEHSLPANPYHRVSPEHNYICGKCYLKLKKEVLWK